MNKLPDFVVVGAPKCGTSSIYMYLRAHPDIYMAEAKEVHYFASDMPSATHPSFEEYTKLFNNYNNEKVVGDVAVLYMYSKDAAINIKRKLGNVKIICMLRHPVEALQAFHAQMVWTGNEDIKLLDEALEAQNDRKKGRRIPKNLHQNKMLLQYQQIFLYGKQLKHLVNIFGIDNIHLIFFEDLAECTASAMKKVFNFLEVNTQVSINYKIYNESKSIRSQLVQKILYDKESFIRKIGSKIVKNSKWKRIILNFSRELNSKKKVRETNSKYLLKKLSLFYQNDITELESLSQRDLRHWKLN